MRVCAGEHSLGSTSACAVHPVCRQPPSAIPPPAQGRHAPPANVQPSYAALMPHCWGIQSWGIQSFKEHQVPRLLSIQVGQVILSLPHSLSQTGMVAGECGAGVTALKCFAQHSTSALRRTKEKLELRRCLAACPAARVHAPSHITDPH